MGMLTFSIGDIHGESVWKDLADIQELIDSNGSKTPKYNKYIFVGDYVDSFTKKDKDIIDNLNDVISFKSMYPDHVVLLWGNHDVQYLFVNNKYFLCSGYRPKIYHQLHEIFQTHADKFQLAFGYNNVIWTHAGVHASWYRKTGNRQYLGDAVALAGKLNEMFDNDNVDIYDVGYIRGGMMDVGGPLWVDKSKLYKHPLEGFAQIVGHTHTHTIEVYTIDGNTIAFIDALYEDDPLLASISERIPKGFVMYINEKQ